MHLNKIKTYNLVLKITDLEHKNKCFRENKNFK